ncbi:hypothetical protein PMAYCL1PPCAC_28211 [Pristionchus mayeri]|uniref:Nucleoporin protein Ndc1-Nup n=1 Tax=Pristionchus mayeri TaxID=1317129 RepID=A0AAN5D7W8_9BILA|nr:hypothetical protein PMAYCL1PPCAC_28211 [Pristionchus mayeri]
MDSFLSGGGGAPNSFYEYEYAKADLSSSRLSSGFRSPSSPSNMVLQSPPLVLPSIFDQIAVWFRGIIDRRKVIASAVSSGCSLLFFFLLTALLQASPLSPFASVYGALSLLISPAIITVSIIVFISSFAALGFITLLIAKPDTAPRLGLLRKDAWAAAVIYFMSQMVLVAAVHTIAGSPMDRARWLFSSLAVAFSSLHVIFRNDFRLVFGTFGSKLSLALWECVSLEAGSPLATAAKEAVLLYRMVLPTAAILGFLTVGVYPTILSLLSPSIHFCLLAFSTVALAMGRMHVRITREIVMKPLHFPLPPPHAVRSPTPAQTRTMLNVLEADDATLKVFALTDLARLSRVVGDRRLEIFSLSQPGGHPRNWTSIKNACVRVIEETREKVECATRALGARGYADSEGEDDDGVDRQMLLMPERIRQQVYSTAIRSRHARSLRATAALQPRVPPKPTMWEKAKRFLDVPVGVISRHDATLVQLASESLSLLVVSSFDEDRYGVVQRDLAEVLRALIKAANAVREHFRTRAARATDSEADAPLNAMDEALATAVYQIKNQFGDHLRSLALSKEEFSAIDMMC